MPDTDRRQGPLTCGKLPVYLRLCVTRIGPAWRHARQVVCAGRMISDVDAPNAERLQRAGRVIREARDALGWNQGRLADELSAAFDRLAIAGRAQTVGQSAVSRWENGENAPEPWKLALIEDVLNIDAGSLATILYDRPPRSGDDREAVIEARLDGLELQLAQMIELLHGLDRRIQGRSPGGDAEA